MNSHLIPDRPLRTSIFDYFILRQDSYLETRYPFNNIANLLRFWALIVKGYIPYPFPHMSYANNLVIHLRLLEV
jgi:hypothetical protein